MSAESTLTAKASSIASGPLLHYAQHLHATADV